MSVNTEEGLALLSGKIRAEQSLLPGDSEQVLWPPEASLSRFSIHQHHHHFWPDCGPEVPHEKPNM